MMLYFFSFPAATYCLLLLSSASALPTEGEAISSPPPVVDADPEVAVGEKHL